MDKGNRKAACHRFVVKGMALVCFLVLGKSASLAQTIMNGITFTKEIRAITADMRQKRYALAFALALGIADKSGALLADPGLAMKLRSAAANDHQAVWGLIQKIYDECREERLQQMILAAWDARLKDRPFLFLQLLAVHFVSNRDFLTDRLWRLFNDAPCYETFWAMCCILSGSETKEDLVRIQTRLAKTKNRTRQDFLYYAAGWIRWRYEKPRLDPGPCSSLLPPNFIAVAKELEKKALRESR